MGVFPSRPRKETRATLSATMNRSPGNRISFSFFSSMGSIFAAYNTERPSLKRDNSALDVNGPEI